MPDLDDDLPTVNRCAIVLEPTAAFKTWARSCPDGDPEGLLDTYGSEPNLYLIPEVDAEPAPWLKRNYARMFEEELVGWYRDPDCWPEDRPYKLFREFFEVKFHSLIFDLGREPLERDEE